ncbi:MAG: rhodanese-like domain-containing protein [Firmicutes bacterium]|nr:rhodanese-like domain-containing protein [Clostridiales bacterium]MBQ2746837.1 rhodanese-like domain-containing protein [Bacillota bacterium]MBQ3122554.1 rhodanese-like domain-containing protein [Bacillota bacterium]MBQ9972285.1 rhodanese-like domain-containing protein [Bacillota bacterium]
MKYRNKRMLALVAALMILTTGCGAGADYQQVSTAEAVEMMAETTDYIILDVRTPAEYESGHIPGAINVANETIGSKDIEELPDKDQVIFVYCRSGNRSKEASAKLTKLGYTNIVEFGGINNWEGEIETE